MRATPTAVSKQQPELFVFVWAEFCPGYTDGLAVAIAETSEQAQKLIEQRRGYEVYRWGPVQKFPVDEPVAFCVSGGSVTKCEQHERQSSQM